MKVVSAGLAPYKLRFRAPIMVASGLSTCREGVILRLEDNSGRVGWGDAAPWPGFGTDMGAVRRTLELLVRPDGPLLGRSFRTVADVRDWLVARPLPPETAHAAELAVLDLLAQAEYLSIAELLCKEPRSIVELHTLVTDAASAKEAVKRGARALKIKIGRQALADDVTQVGSIRAVVGPDINLRLDASGLWSRDLAVEAARQLAPFAPEWLEQPVGADDIDGLVAVRAAGARVAVDESGQSPERLERVLAAKAADVLVLKPMFAGGLLAARDLAARGFAGGLKVVVTHALESAVGRVGAMHLAASLEGPLGACGLSDPLEEDVAKAPVAAGGWAQVPSLSGLGVNPATWYAEERRAAHAVEQHGA